MENQGTWIFRSVLNRMIEMLVPNVFNIFSTFETKEIGKIDIEELFQQFPRKLQLYRDLLDTLTDISEFSTTEIIHFLVKSSKQVISKSKLIPFISEQALSPIYNPNNAAHVSILYYFSLFFISDLCTAITLKYRNKETLPYLSRAGYNLANSEQYIPSLHKMIIDQWAVIFSILSEIDFGQISQIFGLFNTSIDNTLGFSLFQYLRLDNSDAIGMIRIDSILKTIKHLHKRHQLTPSVLENIGNMIISIPYSEEVLNKFYSFAFYLRYDKNLWSGAIYILAILMPRLPKYCHKILHFIQKRIVVNANDPQKVQKAVKAFHLLIFGQNLNPDWYYWGWGKNPRCSPLVFIQWNSILDQNQADANSFSSLFMNNFFTKSDFRICPSDFRDIIVHLASLDFDNFFNSILPSFISLSFDDPRFIVFLMCIPTIFSDDFTKYSFCHVRKEQISDFKKEIKPKIVSAICSFEDKCHQHGVCLSELDFFISTIIDESNQNILKVLDEWNLRLFEPTSDKYNQCKQTYDRFTLLDKLVKTIRFVLDKEELMDPKIANLILALSMHPVNSVATVASKFIADVMVNLKDDYYFIRLLLEKFRFDNDPEGIFLLLSHLLKCMKTYKEMLPLEIAYDVEFTGFVCLTSAYPKTRQVAGMIVYEIARSLDIMPLNIRFITKSEEIEKTVRDRLFSRIFTDLPQPQNIPVDVIKLKDAFHSDYYDIWLYYLAEIMNQLIQIHHTPLLNRLKALRSITLPILFNSTSHKSKTENGLFLVLLDTFYHIPTFLMYSRTEITKQIDPMKGNEEEDTRKEFTSILSKLILSTDPDLNEIGFKVARHIHFSLMPSVIDILASVREDQVEVAAYTLTIILRTPEFTSSLIRHYIRRINAFLGIVHLFCIKKELNNSRMIQWHADSEEKLYKYISLLRNFCIIISITCNCMKKQMTETEFPLTMREIAFRFLVNWLKTKSKKLEGLRAYAGEALAVFVHSGPIFSDMMMFDEEIYECFGQLESRGIVFLSTLLHYHFSFLIEPYIRACYIQKRSYADNYLNAIIEKTDAKNMKSVLLHSGSFIVLCLILQQRDHPRASELVEKFLRVIELTDVFADCEEESSSQYLQHIIPEYFSYAAESIFKTILDLLKPQVPAVRIPVKDIIEAVKPWTKVIRILPKSKTCAQGVTEELSNFTPYEFLVALMETTEVISDDEFISIASLWFELQKSPDHKDIIPAFINSWPNFKVKQKLFSLFLELSPGTAVTRISSMCSFAHYYYMTHNSSQDYNQSTLWTLPLLANTYKKNWDILINHVSEIIHFSILIRNESSVLFDMICHQLKIECPIGHISYDNLRLLTHDIIENFQSIVPDFRLQWGNEALKWLFASCSLEYATTSFVIYNELNEPYEDRLLNDVVRIVAYFLTNFPDDTSNLVQLVDESMIFFSKHFQGHERLAYDFVSAFLECRTFMFTSIKNTQKIFASIRLDPDIFPLLGANRITIIRPTFTEIESNEQIQQFINYMIEKTGKKDLMMIVAPFKMANPALFPQSLPFEDLFLTVNDTVLGQTLSHYSFLMNYCSRFVLNAIFAISSKIIQKVADDHNKIAIFKIYKKALRSLIRCTHSIDFIRSVAKILPNISQYNDIDFYDWDRSLEDVTRSVKMLVVPISSSVSTITDCKSYTSVISFPFTDTQPKILPFSSQKEMLEGMMRMRVHRPKRHSKKHVIHAVEGSIKNSYSEIFHEISKVDIQLTPLLHPTNIVMKPEEFILEENVGIISPAEFVRNSRRSSSVLFNELK